jgi:glycolate dehydrogenase FAD-binding subunit
MTDNDISKELQNQVQQAIADKTPLSISAGNSKKFYGNQSIATSLDVSQHSGIISYEPTELVVTVRAGSNLKQIEKILEAENQMFGFEPPAYAETATIGGTIACNLSGPRRAFSGAARDFVLGCKIINGKGEILHFGGEVMKNVAGYDVSRLMCGAMGTLGVLLELSIKVLPKPETEVTLIHEMKINESLNKVHQLNRAALPISATSFDQNNLYIRLSGSQGAVSAATKLVGGDELEQGDAYWLKLKEHQMEYFKQKSNLWRLSLASNTPALKLSGKTYYEWNGALRWLVSDENEIVIRETVAKQGGHAVCYRQHNKPDNVFHPLDTGLLKLHQKIKNAFDPCGIFNPGKMYSEI